MCDDPRCQAEKQALREEIERLQEQAKKDLEFRAHLPHMLKKVANRGGA